VLGNALLAGIASGIGRAFTLSNTTQSVTPLGGVQTVDPGKALEAGAGLGVSRALDQLANYYIRAAEKLFPVIEIDGGRVVEVLITKGASVPIRPGDASLTNLLTRDGPRASED
jgi:conjugal transfer pilus assembly protein TraB